MTLESLPPELTPRLLRTTTVAAILDVSVSTVKRYAADGVLPAIQYAANGPLHFRADDVAALLRTRGDP